MTSNNILLPVLAHMFTAVALLFCWNFVMLQRIISVLGNLLILIFSIFLFQEVWKSGIQTMQAGDWPAPYGISLVADVFSSTMVLLTGISGLAVSIFSTVRVMSTKDAIIMISNHT